MKTFAPLLGLFAAQATAEFVNGIYWDEWHNVDLPGPNVTEGINHVYISFVNPTALSTDPIGNFTPFVSVDSVRERFGNSTKVILSVGGWTWTPPFANASADATARELFAKNVATMLEETGADGVDIDWEYPCGNGIDYKQVPNSEKTGEAETFPALLEAIRSTIGEKELSIAVPGLKRDMLCYTNATVPRIAATVDYFHVMTYDLMNRRDNVTKHHSDVAGSLEAVEAYLSMGLPASKTVLGFAFYAKYFTTDPASDCATNPIGCAIIPAEDADGNDAGNSGALTFETANMVPATAPTNLTASPDGSCGVSSAGFMCSDSNCCSSSGYCGSEAAYCGTGCQEGYGNCTGVSITSSWARAQAGAVSDTENGGEYFWDSEVNIFWTWDTPEFIAEKFEKIVTAKGLGGVMGWSFGEDTYDNSHILAINAGVKAITESTVTTTYQPLRARRVRH